MLLEGEVSAPGGRGGRGVVPDLRRNEPPSEFDGWLELLTFSFPLSSDLSELLPVSGVMEQLGLAFALSLEETILGLVFVASSALTFLACLLPL